MGWLAPGNPLFLFCIKSVPMKRAILFSVLLLSIIYLSSCSRSLTPYEAASGKYRKCMRVR